MPLGEAPIRSLLAWPVGQAPSRARADRSTRRHEAGRCEGSDPTRDGMPLIIAVVGAGIGLFGTLITTSRQIDRQERNARRVVYAGYLKSAIRATDLLTDQRRAFEEANSTADAYYHFLDEARDPANARSVDYIRLQVDKQWTQSQDARDRLGSLLDESTRLEGSDRCWPRVEDPRSSIGLRGRDAHLLVRRGRDGV